MSISQNNYITVNTRSTANGPSENQKTSMTSLVDDINLTRLNNLYSDQDSLFKQRIDRLNVRFYIESEKYMKNPHLKECVDQLFIILVKQISLYIEEIERLNKQLAEKKDDKTAKEMIDEVRFL